MHPDIEAYLANTAEMITLAQTGIAGARDGSLAPRSARLTSQALKTEARRARGLAKLPGVPAADRKALRAAANHADRLRVEALKLL